MITVPAESVADIRSLIEVGCRSATGARMSPQAFSGARRQLLAALPDTGPARIEIPVAAKSADFINTMECGDADPRGAETFAVRRSAASGLLFDLIAAAA